MDHAFVTRRRGRLIAIVLGFAALVVSVGVQATGIPPIVPMSVTPTGVSGSGLMARVTYGIGSGSEATFVTRNVFMSADTLAGIAEGAAAAELVVPLGTAILAAMAINKFIIDPLTHQWQNQGQNVPSKSCTGADYWSPDTGGTACSVPGVQALMYQALTTANANAGTVSYPACTFYTSSEVLCTWTLTPPAGHGSPINHTDVANLNHNAPQGTVDIAYTTQPTPATNPQVAAMVQQNPQWWPQLFTDPLTGNVVVNPDIAADEDALKQQLAPQYGVDPSTIPKTQPDPGYTSTQPQLAAQPQPWPSYCGWAAEACDYYAWVKENWPTNPNKNQYTDEGCNIAPPCSGDQVMCAVATNTWAAKCSVAGDGTKAPDFGKHVASELDQPDVTVGDTSQLDQSGFGYGTSCPFVSTDIPFGEASFHLNMDPICEYGPWLRYILLALCAWKCGEIVAGLRSVK
jgi:hypothetical protein